MSRKFILLATSLATVAFAVLYGDQMGAWLHAHLVADRVASGAVGLVVSALCWLLDHHLATRRAIAAEHAEIRDALGASVDDDESIVNGVTRAMREWRALSDRQEKQPPAAPSSRARHPTLYAAIDRAAQYRDLIDGLRELRKLYLASSAGLSDAHVQHTDGRLLLDRLLREHAPAPVTAIGAPLQSIPAPVADEPPAQIMSLDARPEGDPPPVPTDKPDGAA